MSTDASYNLPISIKDTRYNEQWTEGIFDVLDRIRVNCYELSEIHSYKYEYYKEVAKAYRIPIIVLSGINTFAAVGLNGALDPQHVGILTSLISLACGIITAVELYLNVQKKMENELISHKDYYKLSLEIYKTIKIEADKRGVDGKTFLDDKFNAYEKLLQNSNDAKEYSVMQTDYLTPPLMEDVKAQVDNETSTKLSKYFKVPSFESITSPKWHQMKKERAKRSEMRSQRKNYPRMVSIPESHSESYAQSDNASISTHGDINDPITITIKDNKDNVLDKYNIDNPV